MNFTLDKMAEIATHQETILTLEPSELEKKLMAHEAQNYVDSFYPILIDVYPRVQKVFAQKWQHKLENMGFDVSKFPKASLYVLSLDMD